jgi:hypothetical protein
LRLFERLAHRPNGHAFHTAIVATFSVEFAAFEQILLPQFDSSGATNIVLIADRRMMSFALTDGSLPPKEAGRSYVVAGPEQSRGVFHPKIILQVGRRVARVLVASANATSAGIGGNFEIAAEVGCTDEISPEQEFVGAVWRYLVRIMTREDSPAGDAFSWAERHAPWLLKAGDTSRSIWALDDRAEIGFFANGDGAGRSILSRFVERIARQPVDHLVVIGPYWDHDLAALRALMEALRPSRTIVVIQEQQALFPAHAAGDLDLLLVRPPSEVGSRFLHAKLIIATVDGFDHVLLGSANCTTSALGTDLLEGPNGEACVFRRLPAGEIFEALGLWSVLASEPIAPHEIPAFRPAASIPLDDLGSRAAGEFEADFGILSWRPPPRIYPAGAEVKLLDMDLRVIDTVMPDSWQPLEDRLITNFESAADKARFARFRRQNGWSVLAIVHRKDSLRERRRERSNRVVDRANAAIDGSFDLDLNHLELLTQLERADDEDSRQSGGRGRRQQGAPVETGSSRVLTYDEFVRTKQEAHSHSSFSRNALGERHVNSIRGLLNRIIGADVASPDPDDQPAGGDLLDLVDETAQEAEPNLPPEPKRNPEPPAREPKAPLSPFDPKAFETAVDRYAAAAKVKATEGSVTATDVLRMRLLVSVLLCHAASAHAPNETRKLKCGVAERDWPRLIVRVLAAFFFGKAAPITRLAVDPAFDRVPDDFIEAWATAIWAIDACRAALSIVRTTGPLLRHVDTLARLVHQRTGLSEAELSGEVFKLRVDRLERRFGPLVRRAP